MHVITVVNFASVTVRRTFSTLAESIQFMTALECLNLDYHHFFEE